MRVLLLVLSVALIGCLTPNKRVDQAIAAFEAKDYAAAVAQFDEIGPPHHRLRKLNERRLVRYYVFRGLSLYRLYQETQKAEHRDAAREFLLEGERRFSDGDRSFLTVNEEREMRAALAELVGE